MLRFRLCIGYPYVLRFYPSFIPPCTILAYITLSPSLPLYLGTNNLHPEQVYDCCSSNAPPQMLFQSSRSIQSSFISRARDCNLHSNPRHQCGPSVQGNFKAESHSRYVHIPTSDEIGNSSFIARIISRSVLYLGRKPFKRQSYR